MTVSRYEFLDAYTLEELRLEYFGCDFKNRIRILKELQQDRIWLPQEISLWAVKDEHIEVRRWIAKNGKFSRTDDFCTKMLELLRNDQDEFVRVCLLENPDVFHVFSYEFPRLSHIERLAMLRNANLSEHMQYENREWIRQLILKIFDHNDKELNVSLEQRSELVLAILSNKEFLIKGKELQNKYNEGKFDDGLLEHLTGEHAKRMLKLYSKLWRLASKWPDEISLIGYMFKHVPADDETKAEIYKQFGDDWLYKNEIISNCDINNKKVIEVAMQDNENECRSWAYSMLRDISGEKFQELINTDDAAVLEGLAGNESLNIEQLEMVAIQYKKIDTLEMRGWYKAQELIGKKMDLEDKTVPKDSKVER